VPTLSGAHRCPKTAYATSAANSPGYRILRFVLDDLHPDEAELTVGRLRRMLAPA